MTALREKVRRAGLGPARADVLAVLRSTDQPQPVQTLAEFVGLHPNTTRFHLDALVAAGLAAREDEPRHRPGRPKLLYRAVAQQPSEAAVLQEVALALIRHLGRLEGGSAEQAEAAGRLWGEQLANTHQAERPLDRVVSTLDGLGYQPELVGDPAEVIVLTPCPLRSLLGEDESGDLPTICRLHLGLMRGLLDDDPQLTVDDLQPLVTPTTCVARLLRRDA